jgi:SET domain-containing protein
MMRTENGEVIDPTYYGNIARFINHSCDPNCVTRKWTVLNETAIGIFARRDIMEDEELAFDYHFDSFKTPFSKCYCGSWNCKGYLGLASFEDENAAETAAICEVCKKTVLD